MPPDLKAFRKEASYPHPGLVSVLYIPFREATPDRTGIGVLNACSPTEWARKSCDHFAPAKDL